MKFIIVYESFAMTELYGYKADSGIDWEVPTFPPFPNKECFENIRECKKAIVKDYMEDMLNTNGNSGKYHIIDSIEYSIIENIHLKEFYSYEKNIIRLLFTHQIFTHQNPHLSEKYRTMLYKKLLESI